MFSDREVLIGLFDLIGAVAEKMTGERPIVRIESSDGQWINVRPNDSRVTWTSPGPQNDPESEQSACLQEKVPDAIA